MFDMTVANRFTTADEAQLRRWASQHGTVQCTFVHALVHHANTLRSFRDEANALAQRMTRAVDEANRGRYPNSLGEVQQQGSRVDGLCAKLGTEYENLQQLAKLLPATDGSV